MQQNGQDLPLQMKCTYLEESALGDQIPDIQHQPGTPHAAAAGLLALANPANSPTGVQDLVIDELTQDVRTMSLQAIAESDLWDDVGDYLDWADDSDHDDGEGFIIEGDVEMEEV